MPQPENFREILRKSGHKATPSRLAILGAFKKNKNPMSAQEIIAALSSDADQATVYRTLSALKKKGVLRQIDLRHNHAHYELTDIAEHHHLICLSCGRIEDVHRCGVEAMQHAVLHGSKHFAEIRQHALEFYGICKSCKLKKETTDITAYRHAPL
jgi:Fur family ferric uptake transcriptional regulator